MRILIAAIALSSCVHAGDRWNYRMNRARTSTVVRDASAIATVERTTSQETDFRVDLRAKPILGAEREQVVVQTVDTASIDPATIDTLRTDGVMQTDEFRATYVRQDGACDWVKLDQLPDQADARDIVINAKVCDNGVPMLDITTTTAGRRVTIGLDRI